MSDLVLSALLIGPLFLPILNIFLRRIPCLVSNVSTCLTAQMQAISAVSLISLFIFIFLCVAFHHRMLHSVCSCCVFVCYVNKAMASDPLSLDPTCRPSNRILAVQMLMTVIQAIFFQWVVQFSNPWALVIIYLITTLLNMLIHSHYLPYYRFYLNEVKCVQCVFKFSFVCTSNHVSDLTLAAKLDWRLSCFNSHHQRSNGSRRIDIDVCL